MNDMSQLRVLQFAFFALSCLGLAQPQLKADVLNGGFETGDFTGWTLSGNTDGMGVETGTIIFSDFHPHSGSFFAVLGPVGSDGFLSQTLSTVAGGSYLISLSVASDGQTPNDFSVSFDGRQLFWATDLPQADYITLSLNGTATTSSTDLSIAFRNDPGYLALDDVSVSQIPEPATLLLLSMLIVVPLRRPLSRLLVNLKNEKFGQFRKSIFFPEMYS
jgi:hypothetical protein